MTRGTCHRGRWRKAGFVRNLREGFSTLGVHVGDPRLPLPPRIMCAWGELTRSPQVA